MSTRSEPGHGRSDPGLDAILSERRQLINLAYRLLGSLAEAEDAVQEAYTRWYAMSRQQQDAIDSPGAWLTTVASRICLNLLGSARARRETYVGEWIPEPLPERTEWINGRPGDTTVDPADRVTLDESVSMAFLVVLDPDATAIADGGGLATTFLHPIEGGQQIAHAWVELAGRVPGNMTFLERTVNGQPGLEAQQDGVTVTVFAFEVAGDRIKHIWVVRNPEKLRPWTTS
jgi:DNA-directed RNA polymerase specialized sigma24 family protein